VKKIKGNIIVTRNHLIITRKKKVRWLGLIITRKKSLL